MMKAKELRIRNLVNPDCVVCVNMINEIDSSVSVLKTGKELSLI